MNSEYHLNKVFLKNPLKFDDTYVFQIGRLWCGRRDVVDTHIHGDLFELTVVTDGRGTVTTNGITQAIGRGDIYLSFPCDAHRIDSDAETPLKYDFLAFRSDNEAYRHEFERLMLEYHTPTRRVITDERIGTLVGNAISEIDCERPYSRELLASILHQILIYLIRNFQASVPEKHSDTVTPNEALCYRLMNYVDTHIFSLKSLDELAAHTGYSYGYLSTLFKKTTSSSLFAYYHKKKLEIAAVLLTENKLKISEIAERLNYSTVYAFSKAFTKSMGISPKAYRRNK